MNIVLIGYRGTGKSTVAQILGERLGRRVLSTDAEVVRRIGCPIPEFVAREGWDRFRDMESEVCAAVAAESEAIVDCGGGAIVRPQNVNALRSSGRVFWLVAHPETIAERIRDDSQRPSLTGTQSFLDEIQEVLKQRLPLYQAAADCAVETDGRTPVEIAANIVENL